MKIVEKRNLKKNTATITITAESDEDSQTLKEAVLEWAKAFTGITKTKLPADPPQPENAKS